MLFFLFFFAKSFQQLKLARNIKERKNSKLSPFAALMCYINKFSPLAILKWPREITFQMKYSSLHFYKTTLSITKKWFCKRGGLSWEGTFK